jgi:cytochrome c oxidase assembly factor CtaG
MEPSPWSWHWAPGEIAVVAVLAAGYALTLRRYPVSRARAAVYGAGVLLVAAALLTPLSTISLHYLLSAHLVQNVILAEWAPALLVAGLAPALAADLGRHGPIRLLTHPLVALPVWLTSYAVWHIPAVYDAALEHHVLLFAEHLSYLLTGALLWWPVLQDAPHKLDSARKGIYLFAAFLLASPVSLMLTLLPSAVYDFYVDAPRLWGLSATSDQQIAGVFMTASEAVVFFAGFAFYFLRFLREEA